MIGKERRFDAFPKSVKHSLEHPDVIYERADNLYAVRRSQTTPMQATPVVSLDADGGASFLIYRGMPDQYSSAADMSIPVYTLSRGNNLAVPTGRVFIRFSEGIEIASRQAELKRVGYRLAQTLAYASNAGWLEAEDMTTLTALKNIGKLGQLADIANIEPQFLSARVTRSSDILSKAP